MKAIRFLYGGEDATSLTPSMLKTLQNGVTPQSMGGIPNSSLNGFTPTQYNNALSSITPDSMSSLLGNQGSSNPLSTYFSNDPTSTGNTDYSQLFKLMSDQSKSTGGGGSKQDGSKSSVNEPMQIAPNLFGADKLSQAQQSYQMIIQKLMELNKQQ